MEQFCDQLVITGMDLPKTNAFFSGFLLPRINRRKSAAVTDQGIRQAKNFCQMFERNRDRNRIFGVRYQSRKNMNIGFQTLTGFSICRGTQTSV